MSRKYYIAYGGIALIIFLVYLPALSNGFVNWDDQLYVYENADIRSIDARFLKLAFTSVMVSNWHPLTMLSYAVDYSIWGLNPFGYHLFSIVLHAINTLLAAILAKKLAEEAGAGENLSVFIGAALALLFGLHPLRVESVAWVSEKKDVLSGFFFFLSLISYLKYKKTSKALPYALSLFFFIFSVMGKPMSITLPAVLLILDFHPLDGFKAGVKKALIEKAPFFALSVLFAGATVWAQASDNAIASLDPYPMASRMLVSIRALAFYIFKTLLPINLAPFYPRDLSPSPFGAEYIASLALVIAITALSILLLKRSRLPLALWLFYLATLSPVIGIIQVGSQAAADRYAYIPGLAPLILIAAGGGRLFKRRSGAAAALAIACAIVLGALTVRQVSVWKDSVSLWSHEVAVYPDDAPIGWSNLGLAYKDSGELDKAVASYEKAIEIDPNYADAYGNRGVAYLKLGRMNDALEDLSTAIRLNPESAELHGNRGVAFITTGEYEKAIGDLSESIRLSPSTAAKGYFNRGISYKALGMNAEAVSDFTRTIEAEPSFGGAHNNRGGAYLRMGSFDEAIEDFSAAVRIDPEDGAAHYNLGLSYLKAGDAGRAAASFTNAASLGIEQAEAQLKLLGR
ncbi:MAG: tetratricopeptide repeat protein [Deltaproteobacteria bacterium]|nr:tetratricopeptide repeat protein [Deltaproteobacteria bacterium]